MDYEREAAAKAGEMFFQSKPCRACGGLPRYVSTGKCVACTQGRSRQFHVETMRKLKEARESTA